ncbi:PrsW family intramembrane metalloprotease [Glycomyces luteolus]|uniref:PrsW family intramembrane metalloprotease n=1 Tax=Glycomyces luteolus TaxID=2670330 RepID=A0A9X3PA32_9ACTN|nr:PrsW family intramembrane metalloprotease [Glycomyces luteolus]MDA1361147.1 PrsW family intramembrane metalloprotease [Glycomyces luteolus]
MTVYAHAAVPRPPAVSARTLGFWTLIALSAFGLWTLRKDFLPVVMAFPGSAVLDLVVLAVSLAVAVWIARRFLRPVQAPPWSGTWLALMWGAFGACGLALVMNGLLLAAWSRVLGLEGAGDWAAALTAPVNEEAVKAAGVMLLACVSTRLVRSTADGFVYGALVGFGFQLMENFTYGLNGVALAGGVDPVAATGQVLWVRILLTGIGSHWTMSAVAGAGIGYLVSASGRSTARRVWVAVGCMALAMGMHWLFDSPLFGGFAGAVGKPLVNFAILIVVYLVVRRGFRARWDEVAEEEVRAGSLAPVEAASLSRRRARRRYLRGFGPVRVAQERMQQLQLDLLEERVPRLLDPAAAQPWRDAVTGARQGTLVERTPLML